MALCFFFGLPVVLFVFMRISSVFANFNAHTGFSEFTRGERRRGEGGSSPSSSPPPHQTLQNQCAFENLDQKQHKTHVF